MLRQSLSCAAVALGILASAAAYPVSVALPEPNTSSYCSAVQRILASTAMTGQNTVFSSMAEFRHSKPSINPLRIYQVATYAGAVPIVVSCKVKSAAQLRAAYGPKAAGPQLFCWDIARLSRDSAAAELRREGKAAAAVRAAAFVIDRLEPYITGWSYLADFQAIYRGADGAMHLNSPGLFQDYDSWITVFLPSTLQGQSYCHLATIPYIEAVATGSMPPGATITTNNDAAVRPR